MRRLRSASTSPPASTASMRACVSSNSSSSGSGAPMRRACAAPTAAAQPMRCASRSAPPVPNHVPQYSALATSGRIAHEVRRAGDGGEPLRVAHVRRAEHPDAAVRPRLLRRPLHGVVPVVDLDADRRPVALRLEAAARVLVHDHVPGAHDVGRRRARAGRSGACRARRACGPRAPAARRRCRGARRRRRAGRRRAWGSRRWTRGSRLRRPAW